MQNLVAGDTLIMHGGTYTLRAISSSISSATKRTPITIRAAAGEQPAIHYDGAGQNIVNIVGARFLVIGIEFSGGSRGIRLIDTSDFTMRNCHVHDTAANAISANDGGNARMPSSLSAETESLVKLINELPSGCIDHIGAGPLHVSTTKPEASVGGNDGSGHTLDEEQINAICAASEFPVVVGGGVHADDMEMLARSKAAGWFVVSAIAGADDPEAATREMVTRLKAVRGDAKHGYAPRVK